MYLVFKVGFLLFLFFVDDSEPAQSLVMGTTKYGNNFNIRCPKKYGISTVSFKKTKLRNFDDFKIIAHCTKVLPKRSRKKKREMHRCRNAKWFSPSEGDVRLGNTETSCACDEYLGGIKSKLKTARNRNRMIRNRSSATPTTGRSCSFAGTHYLHSPWKFQLGNRGKSSQIVQSLSFVNGYVNARLCQWKEDRKDEMDKTCLNGICHYPAPDQMQFSWVGLTKSAKSKRGGIFLNIGEQYEKQMHICPYGHMVQSLHKIITKKQSSHKDYLFATKCRQITRLPCECFWDKSCSDNNEKYNLRYIGGWRSEWNLINRQRNVELLCCVAADVKLNGRCKLRKLRRNKYELEKPRFSRKSGALSFGVVIQDLMISYKRGSMDLRFYICPVSHRYNTSCHFCGAEWWVPPVAVLPGGGGGAVIPGCLPLNPITSGVIDQQPGGTLPDGTVTASCDNANDYVCDALATQCVKSTVTLKCIIGGAWDSWIPVQCVSACTPFDDIPQTITAQDDVLNGNTATVTCSDPDAYLCDVTSTQCVKTATLVCKNGKLSGAWEPVTCQKGCDVPTRQYGSAFTTSVALTNKLQAKNVDQISPGVKIAIFCENKLMEDNGVVRTSEGTCQNGQIIWENSGTTAGPFCGATPLDDRTGDVYLNCGSYVAHCTTLDVQTSCKATCANPPDPAAFNFVFLVDDSASVKAENFDLAKNFIGSFIQQYTIGTGTTDSLTSAITFSNTVNTAWSFGAPIDSLAATQTAIQSLQYGAGVSTDITKALEAARERLTFNSHVGTNVVILITDGRHNVNPVLPETEAAQIRAMANTIILGVAVNIDDANLDELNQITTGSTTDNSKIISIPDYASLAAQTGALANLVTTNS